MYDFCQKIILQTLILRYDYMKPLLLLLVCLSTMLSFAKESKPDFDVLFQSYKNLPDEKLSIDGQQLLSRNKMDSAMAVFTILANRHENPKTQEAADYACQAHNCLGMICFMNSNYSGAYSHFSAASELRGEGDSAGKLNLSAIYLYYGDQQRAYQLMRNVFDDAVRKRNYHMASSTMLNLLTSDIDESVLPPDTIANLIRFYRRNVHRSTDNPEYHLVSHMASAKLLSIEGRHEEAIHELKESLRDNGNTLIPSRNLFSSYEELGKTFHAAGLNDSAIFYLGKAEDIARSNNFPELLMSAYSNISKVYGAIGQKSLEDEYRYKRLNLNDSLFTTREFGKIHDLEMFHQADKFERHLNRLSMEKELRGKVLWVISIALIILSGLLIFIFRQNRSLQRKNKNLFEMNLEVMNAQKKEEVEINSNENTSAKENENTKYNTSGLSDETAEEIKKRILQVMSNEETFCREDFSLRDLAELCESNSKYVSQVLNERIGMSFSQYLNERRVSVARRMFVDHEKNGHLTIEAIVGELGYKSRSSFSKTFKRITGLSPSEFQRMAREGSTSHS